MTSTLENCLGQAISAEYINYLEYNKFTDCSVIDIGNLGTVFKHKWEDRGLTVVLKCIIGGTDLNENVAENFIHELTLLKGVSNHQNIIAFYGVTKDYDDYYNIVLQHADGGNLREYLKSNFRRLRWTDKLRIAKEISYGLQYLHNNNIIHRNLHSRNILIHQNQPKIADFELLKQIDILSLLSDPMDQEMVVYIDPHCFTTPEYNRDKKSDVYSFGVILWEISSGRLPFQSFEPKISLAAYIYMGNREKPMINTPHNYIQLYEQCWDINPSNRPETILIPGILNQLAAGEIIDHPMSFEITTSSSSSSTSTYWPVTINSLYLHETTAATTYSSGTANSINSDEITATTTYSSGTANSINSDEITAATTYSSDTANSINSHEITTATTLSPYSTSTKFSTHEDNILEDMREEARECLYEGKYFKALELYEEILKNNQHNENDRKSASSWNLSKKRLKDINELKRALCKNTILTSLNLNNNKLGSKKVKILADALCQNTTLVSLNLVVNYLGPKGSQILADALCKNTTLTFLNLTYNLLGSEGGRHLSRALCKNNTLTHLNLLNNQLEADGGRALANALYKNTALTSLNIGDNNIGPEGGKAIAAALSINGTLTSLNISNNRLGSDGGSAFAFSLFKNTTLESLNLSNNEIGLKGGYALANALCENVSLATLELKHNNLGSEGGKILAEALCKNKALISLDLENNKLGLEGGKALAISLFKNTSLVSLNLNNNELSSEGGEALAEALCYNTSLDSLNFRFNNINVMLETKLERILAVPRGLRNQI